MAHKKEWYRHKLTEEDIEYFRSHGQSEEDINVIAFYYDYFWDNVFSAFYHASNEVWKEANYFLDMYDDTEEDRVVKEYFEKEMLGLAELMGSCEDDIPESTQWWREQGKNTGNGKKPWD